MKQRFFICPKCGNIVAFVKSSGAPVSCCGGEMRELLPGTTEAAAEKHIPVFTVDGNTVTVEVGSVAHPMTEAHHIAWVSLETKAGNQRKELDPTGAPRVTFAIESGDEVRAVYAYCNLHGLWAATAD